MHLQITGFLPEPNPDEALKFNVDLRDHLEERALEIMGWKDLEEAGGWESELTPAQSESFSELLETPEITRLVLFVGCVK